MPSTKRTCIVLGKFKAYVCRMTSLISLLAGADITSITRDSFVVEVVCTVAVVADSVR